MPKYFTFPFALSGDKTPVPDAAQVDGSVSYDIGFGFDYERDPDPLVDPLTKDIPRDQTNQLFFDVTENLKHFQDFSAPEWSLTRATSGGGYPANARVTLGGVIYTSTANNNATTPPSATWTTTGVVNPTLKAIADLDPDPSSNQYIYFTSTNVAALGSITSFGRSFIAAADAPTARTSLGIVPADTTNAGLARAATDTEVNTGANNDNLFVNPFRLLKGFQISLNPIGLGVTGYIVLPDWAQNLAIVWGRVSVPPNTSALAYTFPTALYWAGGTLADNFGDDKPAVRVWTDGLNVWGRNTDGGGITISWLAFGKR